MADAGVKLTVEGEKEFKDAITAINKQIKQNKAELKLLTEQYRLSDDSLDGLEKKQKALEDALENANKVVNETRKKYEEYAAACGEADDKTIRLKEALIKAQTEQAKLANELKLNKAALDEAEDAYWGYWDALDKTIKAEDTAGEVMANNRAEIEKLAEQYKALGDRSKDAVSKQENLTAQNKLLTDSVNAQQKKVDALNNSLEAAKRRYGDNSDEVRDYQKRIDEATAELKEMQEQIKRNEEEMSDSGESANGLLKVLDKISELTGVDIPEGLKDMIGGFDDSALAAGGITTALVGVAGKIGEIFQETLDWADELTRKSQEMDLGTEQYQALEYAAVKSGVSIETLEDGMKELTNKVSESHNILGKYVGNMESLRDATDEEKEAVAEQMKFWDDLGVSIYDTATGKLKPTEELLYELIDAFGNISDSGEKAYKMNEIFGESWNKLNPLVAVGTDNLKKWEQEAYNTGVVMDEELVAKADAAAVAFESFGLRASAALRNLVTEFMTRDWWKNWIPGLNQIYGFKDITSFLGTLFGIPQHATGTYNHIGGYALVGEKGPEIVQLPQGSRVYPTGQAPAGGSTVNNYSITIDAKNVQEFNDIVRIVKGANQVMRRG